MRHPSSVVPVVGLLIAFAGAAHAQPTINDNFVGHVTASAERETVVQLIDQSTMALARSGSETATIYEWYTGQMTRFDFTNPDSSHETVYQFWPGANLDLSACPNYPVLSGTGIQYNYSSATDTCTQTALRQQYPATGFFDFLQQAGQNGTCSDAGRSGTLWVVPVPSSPIPGACPDGSICLCANGNTPIDMDWTGLSTTLLFNSFTPGVPALSNFCPPAACAAAHETHDSVVLPRAPLHFSIPAGAGAVTKTVRVRVGNADILPSAELPGHTIQLVAGGDCPAGTIVGIPDFGKSAAGPSDTVVVKGGAIKTAKVTLNIDGAAWTTFNAKAPGRCTLIFSAKTVAPANWYEPTPANNVVAVELNVTDKNDPEQSTTHESIIKSRAPVTVALKAGSTTKTKKIGVTVGNADILPTPEKPGHLITVTASDGDCPAGTVGIADYDRKTPGSQNSVTVKGGKTKGGLLPLTINASAFATTNAKSPSRCTALLTATGPSSPDPDPSNNATKLVIDVIDKNDF